MAYAMTAAANQSPPRPPMLLGNMPHLSVDRRDELATAQSPLRALRFG